MDRTKIQREFLLPSLEDLPYYTRIVKRLGGDIVNNTLVQDGYKNFTVTFGFPDQRTLSMFRRDELMMRGKG